MAGPRKKRLTGNPLLLRRAVSRMGRIRPPVLGGSTLYDVHEPRAGITVLPSIARDSHLVHIMQSSLSNNSRSGKNTRSRRLSRVIPNRTRDRPHYEVPSKMAEQPKKAIRSVSQSLQQRRPNAMKSDQSVRRSDRSRASSIGYPSSWNYEISKEENGLNRDNPPEDNETEILKQFKAPRLKSTDTSVQCKIKVHKKQRNKILTPKVCCVAQTQTGPMEESSKRKLKTRLKESTVETMDQPTGSTINQEPTISHNPSESNCSSRLEEEFQRRRVYSGGEAIKQSSLNCFCKDVSKQNSKGSTCNKVACPYKSKGGKNYGGYSPSETSYERNSKVGERPSEVSERPSERLNRIEKLGSPPSGTICTCKRSKTSQRSWTKGYSKAEETNGYARSPRSESPNGNWRLHLASKYEIESYQQSQDVDVCPEACGKWIGPSEPDEEPEEEPDQEMEQASEQSSSVEQLDENGNNSNSSVDELDQNENNSSDYERDDQQDLPSPKDIDSLDRNSRKRNVGFREKQNSKPSSSNADDADQSNNQKSYKSRPCRCENDQVQIQRRGAVNMSPNSNRNDSPNYKTASFNSPESKEESCDCDCPGCLNRSTENRRQTNQINTECMCNCPACEFCRTQTQKSFKPSTTMPKRDGLNSRNDNISSKRKTMQENNQGKSRRAYPSKPCKCANADTQTLRHGTTEMLRSRDRNGSSKLSNTNSNNKAAALTDLESTKANCDCDCSDCMMRSTETAKNGRGPKAQLNTVCKCKCPACQCQRTQTQKSSRVPKTDDMSPNKARVRSPAVDSPKKKPDQTSNRKSYSPAKSKTQDEPDSKRNTCDCDCPGCTNRAPDTTNKSGTPRNESNTNCMCNCPVCEELRAQTLKSSKSRADGMSLTNSRNNARSSSRNSYFANTPKITDTSSSKKSFKASEPNSSKKPSNVDIPRDNDMSKKIYSAKNPRDKKYQPADNANNNNKNSNSRNYDWKSRQNQYNANYARPICCNCQYPGYQGNEYFDWNKNPPWQKRGFCPCNRPGCTKAQPIHRDIQYNNQKFTGKPVNGSTKKPDTSAPLVCRCYPATTQTSQSDFMYPPLVSNICSDEECDLQCQICQLAGQEANQNWNSDDTPSYCACSTSSYNSSLELESDADYESAIIQQQEYGDELSIASPEEDMYEESEIIVQTTNKEVQCSCNCPHCGVQLNEVPEKVMSPSTTKSGSPRKTTAREAPKRSSPMPKTPKEKPTTKVESSQKDPKTKTINLKKPPISKTESPSKKPMNKTGKSREEPIAKVKKEPRSKQKKSVKSDIPSKPASFQPDSNPKDSEVSPEVEDFCDNETCTNNICGQCTITPAKTNAGDAMVNMVIDEKCNVSQIINILHETVAGLEQQKKLLSQAAAGNSNPKKMQWNSNENNNNTNGKFTETTNKNAMPTSDRQQELPNGCNTETCPYITFNKQVPREREQDNSQPEPNYSNSNRIVSSRNNGKSPSVRIVTEAQHDFPEPNEPETRKRNYDDGFDCDEECCPSGNNNPGVWMKKSKSRKRSGSSYPFDDDTKKCPSLTNSEFKRKTLEYFRPTKSFLHLFDLALIMQKNQQSMKINSLSCKFPNRKSQNRTRMFYNESCLKSREHYEYLENKNPKYIDEPKGPTSYERNILKGFEKHKAECKEIKCPCEKENDDEEPLEDVEICLCQPEDLLETEELSRREADILSRELKKIKSSRRQRAQSEQTDLSTSCSDVPKDSSACGLAFCRERDNKQIHSSRKHSNQCEFDYDEEHKRKDKRLRHQTRRSHLYRCSPNYLCDSSDSRSVNCQGKDKDSRRHPERNVYRKERENKLYRNKCLSVSGENNKVKGVSELKGTSAPEYTKYSHKIYNWAEAENPRDFSLRHPVIICNRQKPKHKPSIFACFKKSTKAKTDLSLFPSSKPSEANQKKDKLKQNALDLKNSESNYCPCFSETIKPKREKCKCPGPDKEKPMKAEPKPSKNFETDDKPKSKSSSLFPCFDKPSKEKYKKPDPKPSKDVKVEKPSSSRLFPCLNKTNDKPKPSPKPDKKEKEKKKSEDFEKDQKPSTKSSKLFPCLVKTTKEKIEKPKDPEPKQSKDKKSVEKPKPKSSGLFLCFKKSNKENLKKTELQDIEKDEKPKENASKTSEDHKQKKDPKDKSPGLFPCFKRNKKTTKKPSEEQEEQPKKEENKEEKLQECEFEQVDSAPEYCECNDQVKVTYYSSYKSPDVCECCKCDDDEVKILYESSYKFCKNRNGEACNNNSCPNRGEKVNLPHESPNHFFSMLK